MLKIEMVFFCEDGQLYGGTALTTIWGNLSCELPHAHARATKLLKLVDLGKIHIYIYKSYFLALDASVQLSSFFRQSKNHCKSTQFFKFCLAISDCTLVPVTIPISFLTAVLTTVRRIPSPFMLGPRSPKDGGGPISGLRWLIIACCTTWYVI